MESKESKIRKYNPINKNFLVSIFIISAIAFFFAKQYGWMTILILGLIPIWKLDYLISFAVSLKDGFQANFTSPEEKIKENIKENDYILNKITTKQNFSSFEKAESEILARQQRKYGGEMKKLIHYVYGPLDKPQLRYTPDGTLQTNDTIYFFEIKHILDSKLAKDIIGESIKYLETVYTSLASSFSKNKKLIIKLILVSKFSIIRTSINIPKGIEVELINN